MKMNCHILIFLSVLCFGLARLGAQEAIVTAGCNSGNDKGSICFTVGQVSYSFHNGTSCTVAEGVHQPFEISSPTGIGKDDDISLSYHIYPNPTAKILHLDVRKIPLGKLSYQLYSIEGKLLMQNDIHQALTLIDFSSLPSNLYILKIIDENKKTIGSFRIMKNQ